MSEHFYRWLLQFYPVAFREEYGEEMLQLFRDRISDERGTLARVRLWVDILVDFAVSVARQSHRGAAGITNVRPVLSEGMTFYSFQETLPDPSAFAAACCISTLGLALVLLLLHQSPANAQQHAGSSSENSRASSGSSKRPKHVGENDQAAANAPSSASNSQPSQESDSEQTGSDQDHHSAAPSQNTNDAAPRNSSQMAKQLGIGGKDRNLIQDRVILLGDSTIEAWERNDGMFFIDKPYLNRSQARQTTTQMLVRFRQDVVELNPQTVVIVGGGADLSPSSTTSLRDIEDNLRSMREIAKLHRISVILSVSPSFDPIGSNHSPSDERLAKLNDWVHDYCLASHCTHLDYYSALGGAKEQIKPKVGAHFKKRDTPNIQMMERLTQSAIEDAAHETKD